nr:hypothetical protein [Tanacetum cinerariifolium]
MSSAFADTHNMVAILTKSEASEGFDQIIDFLNGSYIKYALTVIPHIYVSCIKQFWNTVTDKQSNDVTRLQALVDRKKVVIAEAVIRDALRLADVEGVDCLANEEIFTRLARIGSVMASAVICLSTGRKFNFSKYIFDSLVRNVDSNSKFYIYPRFTQLIIQNQLGDLLTHTTKYISLALTQKVFANMKRVGKGCSRVETPLFAVQSPPPQLQSPTPAQPQGANFPMSLFQEALDACDALTRRVKHLKHNKVAQDLEITKLKTKVKKLERANKVKTLKLRRLRKVGTSQRIESSDDTIMKDVSNQGRMIDELDRDEGVALMGEKEEENKAEEVKDIAGDAQVEGRQAKIQAEIYQIDMDHPSKVLSMHKDKTEVQEVVEVVTTAKLITKVVTAASTPVSVASTIIPSAEPKIHAATITDAPVKVAAASTRRRRGVVKMDEAYARKLHEELNQDIDWDVAIEHVKQKAKEDPFVQRYQVIKKRPQTEAQARRNMIMYLKNTDGFKLDYFKEISYDDIRPIFKAKFNSNMEFLLKSKKQIEEEENRAIESINETPAQKAAKRKKMNEDVEDLKQHLEIVHDKDDDVYTEATPLARKVPVVDYQIIHLNNKPRYKIIRADETHQLAMFGRPDGQDQIWKNQRSVHGQAMVKSWKLLESCGVHIISFTTTQLILLVERRYPLSSTCPNVLSYKELSDPLQQYHIKVLKALESFATSKYFSPLAKFNSSWIVRIPPALTAGEY